MGFILTVFYCTLTLTTLVYFTSFFFEKERVEHKERIQPTLLQRIKAIIIRNSQLYLPLWLLRKSYKLLGTSKVSHKQRKHWVKKLDTNNEKYEWEGYLIADDAKRSEIGKDADMVILYVHGGGFVCGDALVNLGTFIDWIKAWKLSYGANTHILSLEYRLSPEYQFPAARDDILECYQWLVADKKISPSKIIFAGDSAGGNLVTVSAIHLVNQLSFDPPAALVLISPFLSGIVKTPSSINNASYDILDSTWFLSFVLKSYIGDSNLHSTSPTVFPLFENQLSGLPKVWACVGGYEIFLDDIKSFIEKLLKNNVKAELVIEEANLHDYAIAKVLSRNGAYENSIKHIGKFLYGEKKI